jgi:glycopeptide antibiotics resistance protein
MKRISPHYALLCLIAYTLLLAYWMFFGFGRTKLPEYSANLIPFATIHYFLSAEDIPLGNRLINLLGNIGIFIPFGVLLPLRFEGRLIKSAIVFLSGLFVLELLQLISQRGRFDIDDFILNTVGFFLGYWLYQHGYVQRHCSFRKDTK